uniref:Doublecortin domain-containing protein n=1 Tax=Oncorhynchus tshawytscha TaxID=74940 RepID=A0A8C8GSM8_ONCTS
MQSAPAGLWDPHGPQSKDVSSLPVHTPSASRLSHVIAALPTKRITFYKSGDAKFAGVRMAVHKRSFKCFDALLDDLSQKVPLPFGVRTVTTPRGIHSIKHLEQLEDGGCYLCSDRRQAKPINMELAGKRPALWHHNSRRVPQRPAEDPPPPSAPSHTPTRQRRILLVRNSDPAVRRSVILSRRSARSLRVFLEGISEIMQCHVRKLYTLEGRKIDSAQSLMTCPGVLVCVGREPFRPLLLNYVAKHSEEKLPGLGTRSPVSGARSPGTGARSPRNGQGARSRSSVCSEGHGSKKNVNFGLETKKTIIHPLSDSSNRSTRFSLSSDKSYPNGLSSQGGKEAVLNDDIEKRVLVNKDGSLSVEMRVRFRLHNDERLQWSTEIKKSPSDSLTNDCCPLREAPPCFLQQGQSESCSDPDSASCVVEAADYTPKPPQRSLEEPQSHYACCFQRQEYDLWENPAHIQTSKHSHSRVRHTHSSSSSSSCRSSKLVRRRATHRECSELGRVVHGMVEVCTVSSSCSHSELNLGATDNQGEERPLSSSSHVLQALQDDVDDLPPSVSRCCHSNEPPQALPLTPQPPNPMSTSPRSRKHTPALQGEERGSKTSSRRSSNSCSCCRGEVTPKADEERVDSSLSKASHASHRSRSPSNRISIPVAPEEGDDEAEQGGKRAVSISGGSGESIGSVGSIGSSVCSHCGGCDQGYDPVSCHSQKSHRSKRSQEEEEEERSGRGLSGGSDECGFSQRTNKSNCTHFYQEGRAASMMSHMSLPEEGEDTGMEGEDTGKEGEVEVGEKIEEGEKDERAASVLSAKSFSSVKGRTSRNSQKSKASESLADMEEQMEEPMEGEEKEGEVEDGGEQRAASIMSVKSNLSAKSSRSHTSTCSKADGSTKASERASPRSEPDVAEDTGAAETEDRGASVMSAKTNTSANSSRSHKSTKSPNAGAASASSETPDVTAIETTGEGEEEEVGEKTEERLESSMSVRSNLSAKSRRSCKSTCSKAEQVLSANSPEVPATEPEPTGEDEGEERATISTSVKSNLSAKSSRSHSPKPAASETLVNDPADADAAGALSAKTNASAKSRRSCKSTGDDEREEREARATSAKTRASIKFSRTHKSACKAASTKPAACETPVNDPEEKTEEEKTASALSAKTSASVRSSRSHKSTCSRSVRAETPVAKDIPAIETTEGDENGSAAAGETEERPASAILDNNNASVKSSISHKSTCSKAERAPSSNSPEVPATEPEPTGDDEGEKRAASATSKSSRSLQSTCSRNVWAETPGTKDIPVITTTGGEEMVDDTTAAGDTEERPPSAISAKTSASVKSSRSHKSTCSRRAESRRSQPADLPVIETTGREEVGEEKERADSVMSAKSNASAMSRKSNRPTCNGSSRAVSPVAQDVPAIETTGGKEQRDKSTASVKTNRSHKSSSGRRAETPTAEQADVNETTGRDEKGEGTERPASAMSTKYSASAKSSRSHKSTCNSGSARAISPAPKTADVPAIETTGVDREGEKTEERPASAMLAKSYISAKSSTSHTSNGSNRSMFLHLKKERGERGVRPASSTTGNDLETGSVKSAMSTKPKRNADSSTRPLSTASQANAKSTNHTPPTTTETKEESQSHATSRPASTAAHRDDDVRDHVTEKKAPSVHSKSPAKAEGDSRAASFARSTRSKVKVQKASEAQDDEMPETRASFLQVKGHRVKAQSDTGSVHSVKTSKTDKIVIKGNSKPKSAQAGNPTSQSFNPPEGSRPAIQLGTASVSDSLLSQSLSAADLLRGNMATSRLSSPAGSKVSIPDSGKSGKSGSSQRRRKLKQEEAELEELGPLCLPKTSPNDIVSDWLRGIPADSGMDNPEDEMNEGIEETEVKREEGDEKGGETEGQGGEETEEKQEPIETTEMEQENTAETGQQEEEEEEEQENTAETGQREEEEEQENTAETGQEEEEEEQENTAETGQQEEEEEQENTAETGQQEEEEEQENMAKTGQREEEEEQENTAETGQQEEEEEQENTAETGQQEEEEEQENMAKTGQREEEEEQENTAETGQEEEEEEEEEEQENTAETGQQEEEEEQENMAKTGQREEEEEQENTAETGQEEEEEEEEEEQENTAETGQQEEEEEQENTAETGQQEEEQENTAETGQQEEEEEQENMAETGQEEEEQENTAETGQQDEEVKKAARQPEEEGEVKEEEEERGEEEEEAAAGEKEKKDKEEEEVKKEEEGEVGAEEEGECSECADCCPDPAPPNNDISSPCHHHLFLSRESELPWSCHSSVAVMKVLLNPTLGRCSSLPEISPVYGRRLSSSAKGLLDCLAQLQLIDPPPSPAAAPGPDRDQRYQEVMDILESLWLSKPDLEKRKEGETEEKERLKDSGVDLSSGSAGSGGSGKTRPDETAGDITLIAKGEGGEGGGEGETDGGGEGETDGGGEGEIDGGGEGEIDGEGETDGGGEGEIDGGGEGEVGEGETDGGGEGEIDGGGEGEIDGGGEGETDGGGEGETDGGGEGETYGRGEEATSAELLSDAATPDIASQVRSSPGEDESPPESPPRTGEMLQTLERLKTPGSPSSSDSTAYKSPTDTETDTPEDTPSSGTPPSVQRPLLTKRISQDPDPVWVLNLLKKLEKQFMTHYVDAMAELKVRWDLDNNVMLDTMITELRDEVKKRIQMSIDRELRKIRGRAGRGPRPPNMSRESTITDQRRRRLKVMKVQSVNESDGEQGSGDVSDQRSEDEYCPCDACIRKKAEDKAIKMEAVVAKAPVMMAFDLRKILQMKKDPESPVPPRPTQGKNNDKLEEEEEEQVGNLEVVHEDEEEEETKEDIIPTVIEEDISEKEEEGVTGGEEEGQESHRAESLMGEVGEEIAEEIGAEEQEEDGVVEGTEDEEEEAGEGETGCESAGEDGVEGAETGEGEELVEGEEEEAGEAEAGDQEKDGGDEAGDQEEAAGDEETGVAGETGGEGGTGGEEETPEEETEGNVGVSAEDEEEGGEEEVQLNAVVEFNPEDEEGEEMEGNREIPLIHQMTRTSVESQPGSMENTNPEPRASDPVSQMCSLTLIEPNETVSDGHQMASAGEGSGGKGQRRSRSPARIKRRKPKESGIELDVLDL